MLLHNKDLLAAVRKELRGHVDGKTKKNVTRFFKEDVRFYGVPGSAMGKIVKKYGAEIKERTKEDVFALCEELFTSNYCEEAFIACEWAYARHEDLAPSDFKRFETWVSRYVTNWAVCDTLCNHTVGAFVERYPEYTEKLREWARSDNRWVRRAAAVTLIIPARRGKFLDDVFAIAGLLMKDREDLVQKGYGWLLKEASRLHQKEVFDYLMQHRQVMPRTAFRYALEKMPLPLRKKAMAKPMGTQ